jgi:hypothetical protein
MPGVPEPIDRNQRKGKVIVMSETKQQADYSAGDRYDEVISRDDPTGWVGFVVFGGIMMLMMGGFQVIEGLVALFRDDYYFVTRDGLLISMDFTAWGWTHLIIGLIAVGAGMGVLVGQMWARVLGIVIAVISALANIAFLSAYPVWSVIIIATDFLVIYALAVHGREVKSR